MSNHEKPCPFCGSTNLKSGGDDKIVGTWCLDCEAIGPNHYGRHEWNDRADRIEELEAKLAKAREEGFWAGRSCGGARKEVELHTHAEYLNEHVKYQPEDLLELSYKLMAKAKEEGLQGCYLNFQSTMEPWEDSLGPVQLTICGYRKINTKEKSEQERTDAIEALAKEKSITFHEASILMSLKERGKL